MSWDNLQLRVLTAKLSDEKNFDAFKHGIQFGFPCVGTATKDLLLIEVQLPGKKKIDGKSFLNGAKNWTKQGD
jgi:methionyl-tRNA formyltransferase